MTDEESDDEISLYSESTDSSGSEWCYSQASILSEDTLPTTSQEGGSSVSPIPGATTSQEGGRSHSPIPCNQNSQEGGSFDSAIPSATTSQGGDGSYSPIPRADYIIPVILNTSRPQPAPSSLPPPWYEEYTPRPQLPSTRHTVRRDNRLLTSSSLPVFSAPNCRSIGPKIHSLIEDMRMRDISCVLASETWEKSSSKKFQKELERMIEIEGMKMVSKARKYRRGGGVCIIADISKISITQLDIESGNLEIVWAILKPLHQASIIKEIIVFSFYLPPKSRMKGKMTDHIVTTLHQLLNTYPRAGIMGGGDRNDWSVAPVLAAIPRFQNLQHSPTLNGKNLDVLLSNMGSFYSCPVIVSPIRPDDPALGKSGDHSVPVIYPLDNQTISETKEYKEKTSRPLPDSGIRRFGQMMISQEWKEVKEYDNTTDQDVALQALLMEMLNASCPAKTVKLRPIDKPYITKEMKILDRRRKREYRLNGKSQKYLSLQTLYVRKLNSAAQNFLDKSVRALKDTEPGKAYGILKRLGAQPGDNVDAGVFVLPEHVSLGLTTQESADRIAQKFAEISQEFPPITLENLPDRVFQKINFSENQQKPHISRQMVEEKIKRAKMTKGGVPGDLPVKLSKEFGPELAIPASKIFNNIVQTGKWPNRWKEEQGIALNKVKPLQPKSESELRIISLTPFLSKNFESIIMDWLLGFVKNKMDWRQYGGTKGSSSSHYLIDMIAYILYNQDLKETKAVVAAMVDFEKAFNRQNHVKLITKLSDMGVPGWLLKIIMGFLEDRSLTVKYNGKSSSKKSMPGGGPQGTILGMFLFLILINDAGFPEENRILGERITSATNKRKLIENNHWKYVDDLTLAEAIDLKNTLKDDTENTLEYPLTYHNRTNQILAPEDSDVQKQLNLLDTYCTENEMIINKKKTKVMLFNTSKKRDFTPKLKINNEEIYVVDELKLLGVMITNDLKWNSNTSYITKKGYKKLWILRRLKTFGATQEELKDIYNKQVRSIMEYAAVVWHAGLTEQNTTDIERVQKCAFSIILGKNYVSYDKALKTLSMERLSERRHILCKSFAVKTYKSERCAQWFLPDLNENNTRREKKIVKPVQTRTKRFQKSALPFLTEILNQGNL